MTEKRVSATKQQFGSQGNAPTTPWDLYCQIFLEFTIV